MKPTPAKPIVVSQIFDVSIERVWQAVTDRDQMIKWCFAEIPSFKPVVGFHTRFTVKGGDRDFVHVWKITDVSAAKRISYAWSYEGYPGSSQVTWDLSSESGRTKLTLTHQGMETFPQNIPELTPESGTAGWNYFVRQSLKKYLEPK
ncbi:MAG: SRPBCC domain-containing protein [Candidatus Riflebacteria bacterium]|nr:SRPBCC domain-containing protein [Candidatus Riflebacteria bacterium]